MAAADGDKRARGPPVIRRNPAGGGVEKKERWRPARRRAGGPRSKKHEVVLADLEVPDTTIIVEIPDTTCASVCDSAYRSQINQARLDFSKAFGIPSTRFHRLSTPAVVTVTGVGFYDFNHRQTGGARNGVELHPVLDFQLLQVPQ